VPLQHRQSLMEVLDAGAQVQDLAAWIGQLHAPINLVNYEGEELVTCRAALGPVREWKTLSESLDRIFDVTEDGQWTEFIEIKGEQVVRCTLRRESYTLVVEANSVERFDRILQHLREEVGPLDIIDEVRDELSSSDALADGPGADIWTSADEDLPSEIAESIRKIMRDNETAWLDESLPALAGLTPRQAAADPTRREDLAALLNEFGRHPRAASMETFDVSRLRRELGM
jgi:hypothetical protein